MRKYKKSHFEDCKIFALCTHIMIVDRVHKQHMLLADIRALSIRRPHYELHCIFGRHKLRGFLDDETVDRRLSDAEDRPMIVWQATHVFLYSDLSD